jgi:hypothetical protein
MKLIKLSMVIAAALVAACSGADGADGQDGTPGAPPSGSNGGGESSSSVSLVTPSKGVLDRELEVSIGGSGTRFDQGAELDFGAGIDVIDVITSSPTLITAKLRISKTAEVGPRTVKIGSLEATSAFTVIPAIEVAGGKVAQGGFVQLDITNNDDKAFDPQTFTLEGEGLLDLGSQASGPQAAIGFLLAAPLAPTGKSQLTVSNLGPDGKPRVSFLSAPSAFEITARAPTPFVLDKPADQTLGGLDTKLFKLSTPANASAIVDYRIQVAEGDAAVPVAFVFGTSGQADDLIGQVLPSQNPFTGQFDPAPHDLHVAVPIAGGANAVDHYVVLADISGKAGAKSTITATRSTALATFESPSAHGPDAPQAIEAVSATYARLVTAEMKSDAEIDAYRLSVGASDKIQLTAVSEADLEIIVTKDPTVLEDDDDTPAPQRKVLGYFYTGGKMSAQRVVTPGTSTFYVVVVSDSQGSVKTGKYTLGARKLP